MPYVMVPVPEEHVEGVMQFVLRTIARADLEPWDVESMAELFGSVDEISRAYLSFAARATLSGKTMTDGDMADLIELSVRETSAVLRDINEVAREELERDNVAFRRLTEEVQPNGRSIERWVVSMEPEIARMIVEVEKRDLAETTS